MPTKKAKTPSKDAGISLTRPERELLLEILQEHLGGLREQVYHADTAAFKDQLKAKESLLKGLLSRLSGAC